MLLIVTTITEKKHIKESDLPLFPFCYVMYRYSYFIFWYSYLIERKFPFFSWIFLGSIFIREVNKYKNNLVIVKKLLWDYEVEMFFFKEVNTMVLIWIIMRPWAWKHLALIWALSLKYYIYVYELIYTCIYMQCYNILKYNHL